MGKILCPFYKERVVHTKLCCHASEREIAQPMELIVLLQKTELLENSISVADFAQSTPRQMGNNGPRHNYERDWGWAWR
jgi:hypothetical protein